MAALRTGNSRMGRFRWVYLAPIVVILVWLNEFLYLRGAGYSDLTISHFPNFVYLNEALREFHQVPLWSPAILSGFPFFANPLSGLWYPPGWLAAAWPAVWAFNLLFALHIGFGMFGMARFLKEKGLGENGQLIGALSFGLMPKLLAHFAAGHVTLVYAVAWTPWLLLAEHRRGRIFRPGVVLAIVFLADPRWAVYAGVLWLAFSAAHSLSVRAGGDIEKQRGSLPRIFQSVLPEIALSGLLAAPLLVPLLEYTGLSTRTAITPEEALVFSLPPLRLAGLLLPLVGGQVEWVFYTGGVVLSGSLYAVLRARTRSKIKFWLFLALFSLLFSLGDEIPVLSLWTHLPGANLLRVPSRALFLLAFSLCIMAAYGFDALAGNPGAATPYAGLRRLAVAWAGISTGFIAASFALPGDLKRAMVWAGISGLAAGAGMLLVSGPSRARRVGVVILYAFLVLDSAAFAFLEIRPQPAEEVFSQGREAATWLAGRPGQFRVYSPSYSIPQHTAALYGLELADGVDPLQLQVYADFMEVATGVPRPGYRVTVPALDGDPAKANAAYTPLPELLGRLNVRYLAAEYDLNAEGLELREQFGETRIYENLADRGRVFIEKDGNLAAGPRIRTWTPNKIIIDCPCESGSFVLSEMDYPGWRVIGGEVQSDQGNLRFIETGRETGAVEIVFRPISLYAGMVLFFVGCVWTAIRRTDAAPGEASP